MWRGIAQKDAKSDVAIDTLHATPITSHPSAQRQFTCARSVERGGSLVVPHKLFCSVTPPQNTEGARIDSANDTEATPQQIREYQM